MRELIVAAWRSLSRRALTSVLAVISLAMGVAAYLAVVSLSESLLALQYHDLEADPLARQPSISVFPWLGEGVPVPLEQHEVATVVRQATGREVTLSADSTADAKLGRLAWSQTKVIGVSANAYRSGFRSERTIARGRAILPDDDAQSRAVCLVPDKMAERISSLGRDALGQVLRLNGRQFEIVGVTFHSFDYSRDGVTVPLSAARKLFHDLPRWQVHVFSTEAGFYQDLDRIDAALNKLDGKKHNWRHCCLGWYMDRNYADYPKGLPLHMTSEWITARQRSLEWRAVRLRIGALAATCLLAGLLGLVSMLLADLEGRKYEIGLCRALGATGLRQVAETLMAAATIGLLGGVAGVLFGMGVLGFLSHAYGVHLAPTLLWACVSVAVSTAAALLAGLIPARAAMGISLAEAIRAL